MAELQTAAAAAGCIDLDVLRLAPVSDAPAAEQVAALRVRFPSCFSAPIAAQRERSLGRHFDGATPEQRTAIIAGLAAGERPAADGSKPVSAMSGAELTEFERTLGIVPSHTELARRRRDDELNRRS